MEVKIETNPFKVFLGTHFRHRTVSDRADFSYVHLFLFLHFFYFKHIIFGFLDKLYPFLLYVRTNSVALKLMDLQIFLDTNHFYYDPLSVYGVAYCELHYSSPPKVQ